MTNDEADLEVNALNDEKKYFLLAPDFMCKTQSNFILGFPGMSITPKLCVALTYSL